jgi:hypothetical protein
MANKREHQKLLDEFGEALKGVDLKSKKYYDYLQHRHEPGAEVSQEAIARHQQDVDDNVDDNVVIVKKRKSKRPQVKKKSLPSVYNFPNTEALSNTKAHKFSASTSDIVKAIISGDTIEGVDIANKIQDPEFRFISTTISACGEVEATDISELCAVILSRERLMAGKNLSAKASAERIEKANQYAVANYQDIQNLKAEAGVKSFRKTLKLLTDKGFPTPSGSTIWHISTLQDLQERWVALGLMPDKSKSEPPQP